MSGEIIRPEGAGEIWLPYGVEVNEALFGDTPENLIQRKKMMTHSWPPMPGIEIPAPELFRKWGVNESEVKLTQLLELDGSETILGIGCGTAALEWYLYEHEGHQGSIMGVDINAKLFQEVSQKIADRERQGEIVNVALIEWDDESLPASWGEVGVVIISRVLHHADADAMLREALRVLKVGGKLGVISRSELHFSHMFDDAEHVIAPQLRSLTVPETINNDADEEEIVAVPKYPYLQAPDSWYKFGVIEAFRQIPKKGFRRLDRRFVHGSPDYQIPITPGEAKQDYLKAHMTMLGGYTFTPREQIQDKKPRLEVEDLRRAVYGSIDREIENIHEVMEVWEKTAP